MSEVSSTNESNENSTSATTNVSESRSNANRRPGNYRHRNNGQRAKLKGKLEGVYTLSAKSEPVRGYGFSEFVKSIYQYVLTHVKHPEDLAPILLDREDPKMAMKKSMPTIGSVAKSLQFDWYEAEDIESSSPKEAARKQESNEEVKEQLKGLLATELSEFSKRRSNIDGATANLWGIIVGQCSQQILEQLKAQAEYENKSRAFDCVWLLNTLQLLSAGTDQASNPFVSANDALRQLNRIKQRPDETLEDYFSRFKECVDQVKLSKVTVFQFTDVPETLKELTEEELEERYLAVALLRGADDQRYGHLWTSLANDMCVSNDKYPTTLSDAMHMLTTWKDPNRKSAGANARTGPRREGLSFAQVAGAIAGTDGKTWPETKCYNCNQQGHIATNCPNREVGVQGAHLTMAHAGLLQPGDVLLDNCSSVSICRDKDLVSDLKMDSRGIQVLTNGGSIEADMYGSSILLPKLTKVWYNADSMANILSLSEVKKEYRVVMDSDGEDMFVVFGENGKKLKFKERDGLYVLSRDKVEGSTCYSFLTVEEGKANFSRDEVRRADEAIELMKRMNYTNPDRLIFMLNNGLIRNCHLTSDDVRRAKDIYGDFAAMIQGKSVKSTSRRIPSRVLEPVPRSIFETNKYVTLCIDHFAVNGIWFFHTISKGIKFRTAEPVASTSHRLTLMCLTAVARVYHTNNFRLIQINADMAFEGIREDLRPVGLVTAPAGKKVPEVERSVRVVKERLRCIKAGLPFRRVTKAMTKAFVAQACKSLNDVPPKEGASRLHAPARIVANRAQVDYEMLKVRTGQYCLVIDEHEPWNGPAPRKIGAIALRPKEDDNGWYFQSLNTWRQISCDLQDVTVMSFTKEVIEAVENRGRFEGVPEFRDGDFLVQWRDRSNVEDLTPEELQEEEGGEDEHIVRPLYIDEPEVQRYEIANEEEVQNENEEEDEIEVEDEQVDNEDIDEVEEVERNEPTTGNDMVDENNKNTQRVEENEIDEEEHNSVEEEERNDVANAAVVPDDENEENNAEENASARNENEPEERRYPLRNRKPVSLNMFHSTVNFPNAGDLMNPRRSGNGGFRHGALCFFMKHQDKENVNEKLSIEDKYRTIVKIIMEDDELKKEHVCFTQMTAKKGIATFGKKAIDAIFREFKQLHDKNVFKPIDPRTLTEQQKRDALREITIIKEKRCGTIKGRTCADGRPQRKYVSKDDSSSPTVSNDAFLMSLIIDAFEERDVATADVEGAYLHADMDDFTIMKITSNDHIKILCEVNSEYKQYIEVNEKSGQRTLYVQLAKALYGCIKSALLWYRLFSETLVTMGFQLNPVDRCVANKIINGKQCTVAWYVDDNKISHVDPKVVTEIIEKIEQRFGKMSVTRGKIHTFLGMDISFENKKVKIDMKAYCEQAIDDYHRDVFGSAATPARRDIFEVEEDAPLLSEEDRENFHSVTALLLYVSLRGRPDILLPVSFLCTRVGKATVQDDEKLLRVLKYLNGTLDLKYTLGADSLKSLKIWVDAAFAVHMDMKGHTGGAMSMGTGTFMNKSSKQKLNVLSSTECELVGACTYLQYAIWMCQFLEHQGYLPDEKIFYQDNESAIKFAKNGGLSARKNSKHIDVRFFFIKDRLSSDGYVVEHCRTTRMIADFFTKPLQGKLFRTLRDVVMGVEHISTLDSIEIEDDTELSPSNEERVGKRISRVSFADNNSNEANVEVSKMEGDVENERGKEQE
jgi:hypothetical protein